MDPGEEGFRMQKSESGEFSGSFIPVAETAPTDGLPLKCEEDIAPQPGDSKNNDMGEFNDNELKDGEIMAGTGGVVSVPDSESDGEALKIKVDAKERSDKTVVENDDKETLINNEEEGLTREKEENKSDDCVDSSPADSGNDTILSSPVPVSLAPQVVVSLENSVTKSLSEPMLAVDEEATSAPSSFLPLSSGDLGTPISTSTPVISRNTATSLTVESDSRPLSKEGSESYSSNPDMDPSPGEDQDSGTDHSCGCSYQHDQGSHIDLVSDDAVLRSQAIPSLMVPGSVRVPIIGHETMEARSKFTVYKIHVMVEEDDVGWFIFRRYSDFVHLNDQLKPLFPNVRLTLPPKRWFRSNFDVDFLEERREGLQGFLDNVTGHRDLCNSSPVRDFFCFDDPPGPHDSLEESRAQCECMEEMVYLLRRELADKDTELDLAREELELYKSQVQLLTSRLSELNQYLSHDKISGGKCDIDSLFGAGGVLLKENK
ncbi:sorting nexin-16 [Aplysia californica]|uniref:Sorting nexin-16 n=1 Tax=Aplysia californica TaxID=6500 RepID=A0ABM0JFJ4_APLCA|nr:sorting nexin-16 [Aplysia californica]XP_012934708.1 sorting nexin-16 [Aplysia californica]XP_012934709.1 sorting nexin-16 [Aplysia californica]XP_035824096.1 sorting nexin-16 [Aplysia californica]